MIYRDAIIVVKQVDLRATTGQLSTKDIQQQAGPRPRATRPLPRREENSRDLASLSAVHR